MRKSTHDINSSKEEELPLKSTKDNFYQEKDPLLSSSKTSLHTASGRIKGVFTSLFGNESVLLTAFNISNSTIGTGILFLPYVLMKTGIVFGLMFITFAGMLGFVTVYMLHKSYEAVLKEKPDIKNYEHMGRYLFGNGVGFFIQFCSFFLNFGSTISLTIVTSHVLKDWFSFLNVYWRDLILFMVMTPFVISLMSPKIANLRFISMLSISSIYLFILVIVISFIFQLTKNLKTGMPIWIPDFSDTETWVSFFSYLGTISFSYSCHTSFFVVVSEFKAESRKKIPMAIMTAVLFDYVVFSMVASYGYLCFCDNIQTDIVLSFTGNSWINHVLRVLLAISVLLTYPMSGYPARMALYQFFVDFYNLIRKWVFKKKECSPNKIVSTLLNGFVIIGVIGFCSYLFAVFYQKASVVFGLVGSSVAVFLSYIFPCLFYLKACKPKWYELQTFGVVFVLIFGTVFGFSVTINQLIRLIIYGE